MVKEYRRAGILEIVGYEPSAGGRPAAIYSVNLKALNRRLEADLTEKRYRRGIALMNEMHTVYPLLMGRWGYCIASFFNISPQLLPGTRQRIKNLQAILIPDMIPILRNLKHGEMIVIGPFWKPNLKGSHRGPAVKKYHMDRMRR
jgi:hypothetical protein